MENLLNELHFEEQENRYREAEKKLEEERARMKAEMKAANEYQQRLKVQRAEEEERQEEVFRMQMMQKFAEDDRLEQMNAQKRRMKRLEHMREVSSLWEQKRAMYEAQRKEEESVAALEQKINEEKLRIAEDERQKLLKEYARLREYFPKGVLQHESDKELFIE